MICLRNIRYKQSDTQKEIQQKVQHRHEYLLFSINTLSPLAKYVVLPIWNTLIAAFEILFKNYLHNKLVSAHLVYY